MFVLSKMHCKPIKYVMIILHCNLTYLKLEDPYNVRAAKMFLSEIIRGFRYFSKLVYVLNFHFLPHYHI